MAAGIVLSMTRSEVVRNYGGISADDRRTQRRRLLLDAGRTIWGDSGLADVTVRGVCSSAGLVPRYFYEQFPNRDALVVAVTDEVRAELIAALVEGSAREPGSLEDKLRAALTAFLEALAADPRVHRIMTTDLITVEGLQNRRRETMTMIEDLVVEYGFPRATAGPADLEQRRHTAQFIVGGVLHLIEIWLDDGTETPSELASRCTALAVGVARTR